MGLSLKGLLKGVTAPAKLLARPVKKTISSSKKLLGGNVKGAFNELNLAKPSNIKEGLRAFRSYTDPLQRQAAPRPVAPTAAPGVKDMAMGSPAPGMAPPAPPAGGGFQAPAVGQIAANMAPPGGLRKPSPWGGSPAPQPGMGMQDDNLFSSGGY